VREARRTLPYLSAVLSYHNRSAEKYLFQQKVPWWLIKTFRCGTIASVPSARDSIESPAGAENEQVSHCLVLFRVKFVKGGGVTYFLALLLLFAIISCFQVFVLACKFDVCKHGFDTALMCT
jgi:hypothetical protein